MVWNPRFVNENQVASRVPQGVAPLGSRTFVIEGMGVTASSDPTLSSRLLKNSLRCLILGGAALTALR